MTLEEANDNIGCEVKYAPYKGCSKEECEYGIITSVNDFYVFVKYRGDFFAKATRPESIQLCIRRDTNGRTSY